MAESAKGRIVLMEDFISNTAAVAGTSVPLPFVPPTPLFSGVIGQGVAETDSGAPNQNVPNGVVRLTTTNETEHTAALQTLRSFDVGLMGTLVAEARVAPVLLTEQEIFFGFTDIAIASDIPSIETDLVTGATTTLTPVASDYCGLFLSTDLTATTTWHGVHNGGSTTQSTTSTGAQLGDYTQAAAEFVILRVEIANNGHADFYVNGELGLSVDGAVSTTTNLNVFCGIESKDATTAELDVDYIYISANRDWTV